VGLAHMPHPVPAGVERDVSGADETVQCLADQPVRGALGEVPGMPAAQMLTVGADPRQRAVERRRRSELPGPLRPADPLRVVLRQATPCLIPPGPKFLVRGTHHGPFGPKIFCPNGPWFPFRLTG
jgi:hypothetical protein